MIRARFFSVLIILSICPIFVNAQIIDIEIDVEPELTIEVEQELNFGTLTTNSGITRIGLDDLSLGIFKIRTYRTQSLTIELDYPDALSHSDPTIEDNIPLDRNIYYNNSGDDPFDSKLLANNYGFINMTNFASTTGANTDYWKDVFVYVTGAINIGNIPNGSYSGEALLIVSYD